MYSAVPTTMPVPVMLPMAKRATPKSMILTVALAGEEHVGGLDVAVDDPDLVRVGQARPARRPRSPTLRSRLRGGVARIMLEEVVPAEELHRDVGRAVGVVAEVEDGHHVGVHHARDRARLALEAVLLLRVARDLGQHHLEGDVALQERVAGVVDDAHGARAQAAQDLVLADTRREVRGDGLRLRLRRDFLGIRAQASEFNGGPLALEARARGCQGCRARRAPLRTPGATRATPVSLSCGSCGRRRCRPPHRSSPPMRAPFLPPTSAPMPAPPAADPPMIIALCFLDRLCT